MSLILLCTILGGCAGVNAYMPGTSTIPATNAPTTSPLPTPPMPTTSVTPEPSVPTTTKPSDANQIPVPPVDPVYFHESAASAEELYAKLDRFPFDSAGSKERWQKILLNECLAMLDSEIHRVDYEYLGFEKDPLSGEVETVELFFHPKECCGGYNDNACTVNPDATKLYVQIVYREKGHKESYFDFSGYEVVSEDPRMLTATSKKHNVISGETTCFYYFLNEHYVCFLAVNTEYMSNNKDVVAVFQEYFLSLEKSSN